MPDLNDEEIEQMAQNAVDYAQQTGERVDAIRQELKTLCEKHGLSCWVFAGGFTPEGVKPRAGYEPLVVAASIQTAHSGQALMLGEALRQEAERVAPTQPRKATEPAFFGGKPGQA